MLPIAIAMVTMSFFANVAYVNLPMFAQYHLGDVTGYIILTAFALLGGLVGSFIARAIGDKLGIGKILIATFIITGVARIAFVHVIPNNTSAAIWIYILYIGLASAIGLLYNALRQKLPPKDMVGRVAAATKSLSAAAAFIGALAGGTLGYLLPRIDTVFIIQGMSYIAIGLLLFLSKKTRGLPMIKNIGAGQ